jgi:hypothetical protein
METTTIVLLGIIGILVICLLFLTKIYIDLKNRVEETMDFVTDLITGLSSHLQEVTKIHLDYSIGVADLIKSSVKPRNAGTCKTDPHFKAEMAKRKKKGTKKRPYTKRKAAFWLDAEARKRRGANATVAREAKKAEGTESPMQNSTF